MNHLLQRFLRRDCDLFLGEKAAAVNAGGALQQGWEVNDWRSGLVLAAEWLQSNMPAKARLQVWLSGSLCRPFLLPQGLKATGKAQLMRLAEHLGPQRTGLPNGSPVWLDDGSESDLGVVMHAEMVKAIGDGLPKGVQVAQVRPWWTAVLSSALKADPALGCLGIYDGESLTMFSGADRRFGHASTLTTLTDVALAQAAWARMLVTLGQDGAHAMLVRLSLSRVLDDSPGAVPCIHWVEVLS